MMKLEPAVKAAPITTIEVTAKYSAFNCSGLREAEDGLHRLAGSFVKKMIKKCGITSFFEKDCMEPKVASVVVLSIDRSGSILQIYIYGILSETTWGYWRLWDVSTILKAHHDDENFTSTSDIVFYYKDDFIDLLRYFKTM